MTIDFDSPIEGASTAQPSDAPSDRPPRDQTFESPSMLDDVRNAGVVFAFSSLSIETARTLLKSMQQNRRTRVAAQIDADVARTRTAEQHAESAFQRAR